MRKVVYLIATAALVLAVVMRIATLREAERQDVPSIAAEWRTHGKPVWTHPVARGAVSESVRLSGRWRGGQIAAQVPSATAARLATGQPFSDVNGSGAAGTLAAVAGRPDAVTGLFVVRLAPRGKPTGAEGTIAVVDVVVRTVRSTLKAPRAAVIEENGAHLCWVVDPDGHVRQRRVRIGLANDEFVQVTGGVEVGEEVVVRGTTELKEGDRVRVTRREGRP